MNDKFTSIKNENDHSSMNSEKSDYENLILRLKDISTTITLLEKTIFK